MDEQQFPQGEQPEYQPDSNPNGQQVNPNAQADPFAQYQEDPFAKYDNAANDPNAQQQVNSNQFAPNQFDPNAQQPGAQQFRSQTMGNPAGGASLIEAIRQNPIKVCAYVGSILLILSGFLPRWVYFKASLGSFSQSSGAGLFASDGGILKLYGFLLIIFGLCASFIEFGSYVPSLNNVAAKFRALPFSQFYIPCASFIVWLLAVFNSNFRNVVNMYKGEDTTSLLGGSVSSGYGFVMWMCLIAIILLLVRPVMALIQKKNYWED